MSTRAAPRSASKKSLLVAAGARPDSSECEMAEEPAGLGWSEICRRAGSCWDPELHRASLRRGLGVPPGSDGGETLPERRGM